MSERTIQINLSKNELELIAHVIDNYEKWLCGLLHHKRKDFAKNWAEYHALGTKIETAIEDLDMSEYLAEQPVIDDEVIDNK